MSLRARLVLASSAATALVIVIAGLGLVALITHQERAAVDARLRSQAAIVGRPATLTASVTAKQLVVLEGRIEGGVETRMLRGGRTIISSTGFPNLPETTGIVPVGFDTVTVDGVPWRVLTRAATTRTAAGAQVDITLQVASSLEPVDAAVASVRRLVLVIGLIAIAGGAALAWALTGVVLGPLRRLRAQAERVSGAADLATRVPVDGPREVAEVAVGLNTMLERLQEETARTAAALEASRAFAANAAHELRTPLTSMQMNLDVLERNPDLPAPTRAAVVHDIAAQQQRLLGVLEALRLLARGDLGLRDLLTPVDVADLARAAVGQARTRHPDVTFDLDVREDDHEAVVQGWSEGLRVALDNLLRNAATHGRPAEGGGAPAVRVTVEGASDRVTVHVDDNGPGIPAADRARVLDRFERGTTAVSGSGLGLALAAQQAALHGGDIAIADAPAGGARISLWLPSRPPGAGD